MRFAQNLEVRNSKLGFAPKAFRSTAKPVSPESIRGSWICREDFGIERNQSFKEIAVTHNSVFAAHRLQCRMTTRKIDIRHFVLAGCPCRTAFRAGPNTFCACFSTRE